MSDDEQTELPAADLPAIAPDTFAALAALIALVVDSKACGARLRSLQEQQATAAKATAELTTARATFDQEMATARAELATERASLEKRRLAVHEAGVSLKCRENHIFDLEKAWRGLGEPDDQVLSGFKDPEHSALYKAKRAHGLLDEDAPAPLREDRGGQPFPPDTTITHTPASPPRTAPARRAMRNAAEH
jgi:hypothetical protein